MLAVLAMAKVGLCIVLCVAELATPIELKSKYHDKYHDNHWNDIFELHASIGAIAMLCLGCNCVCVRECVSE